MREVFSPALFCALSVHKRLQKYYISPRPKHPIFNVSEPLLAEGLTARVAPARSRVSHHLGRDPWYHALPCSPKTKRPRSPIPFRRPRLAAPFASASRPTHGCLRLLTRSAVFTCSCALTGFTIPLTLASSKVWTTPTTACGRSPPNWTDSRCGAGGAASLFTGGRPGPAR